MAERENLGERLRTSIWNILNVYLWQKYELEHLRYSIDVLTNFIWARHWGRDLDAMPKYYGRAGQAGIYDAIKGGFRTAVWYDACNLLEVILSKMPSFVDKGLLQALNASFEEHRSAYRIVDGLIVEMTDAVQIEAVEVALSNAVDGARVHLTKALEHLSRHPTPDLANSIKESISAVGSVCRKEADTATLGDALKAIGLPDTLRVAFTKLYAWTNGPEGMRHELMSDPKFGHAEAKYMLVACSAFVTYLGERHLVQKNG